MITKDQIQSFAHQFKTNESTAFREYLQLLFLNKLYQHKESSRIFFKGGTAIHFLFKAPRFSEDLDFTVMMAEKDFTLLINAIFTELEKEEEVNFKERKTITGKRFLLTAPSGILPFATFINLDFSFREKVWQPDKSILDSPYPINFNSFIYHLSAQEICAEKLRALLTRQKGRDFFDLWFLISKGISLNNNLIKEKLKYYQITDIQLKTLTDKIQNFPEKEFVIDLRPFVPISEREKLKERFKYIQAYLLDKLTKNSLSLSSS